MRLLVAAVAALVLLAGCGGGPSEGGALAALRRVQLQCQTPEPDMAKVRSDVAVVSEYAKDNSSDKLDGAFILTSLSSVSTPCETLLDANSALANRLSDR